MYSSCNSRLVNYQVERDTQLNFPDLCSRHFVKAFVLHLAPVAQMTERASD